MLEPLLSLCLPTLSFSTSRGLFSSVSEPCNLFVVPTVIHDLQEGQSLVPHSHYVCAILLLPGSLLLSSHVSNLARPNQYTQVMVNLWLWALFACASSLLRQGSRPHSVWKKDETLCPCIIYPGLSNNKEQIHLIPTSSVFKCVQGIFFV